MPVAHTIRKGAVLAATLVLLTAPAGAAVPKHDTESCAIEHFCLYSRGQQEGPRASYTKGTRDTALQNLPKGDGQRGTVPASTGAFGPSLTTRAASTG